jgi:hypothetical protein
MAIHTERDDVKVMFEVVSIVMVVLAGSLWAVAATHSARAWNIATPNSLFDSVVSSHLFWILCPPFSVVAAHRCPAVFGCLVGLVVICRHLLSVGRCPESPRRSLLSFGSCGFAEVCLAFFCRAIPSVRLNSHCFHTRVSMAESLLFRVAVTGQSFFSLPTAVEGCGGLNLRTLGTQFFSLAHNISSNLMLKVTSLDKS